MLQGVHPATFTAPSEALPILQKLPSHTDNLKSSANLLLQQNQVMFVHTWKRVFLGRAPKRPPNPKLGFFREVYLPNGYKLRKHAHQVG